MVDTRNILVTGGAGYIGSHACKALAQAGYTPVAYDNLVYGHRWAAKWGPLEVGDIADQDRLAEVIRTYRPEAVMHFSAYTYVGESVEKPAKYYRNNVAGTLTLLEAMRDHGIGRFVFSSSCAVYGQPQKLPISEDHPQDPVSPYGASKQMVERLLRDFDSAYGIRSVSLRYFNAAGADPDGEIGESHDPETHLIPLILEAALGQRTHVSIYGNNYQTPDGTCIRDYIHVSDLASAHIKAMDYLQQKKENLILNLATGKGYSVLDVINHAKEVSGVDILFKVVQRRPGDPAELVAGSKLAKEKINWECENSEMKTILESMWNVFKQQMNYTE